MMLDFLIRKAQTSAFFLWLLNIALRFIIPFNRPHGLRVLKVSTEEVQVLLPYRYANLNHVKGIHACALAAAAEFSTGLLLYSALPFSEYRLLMQSLSVQYAAQAKMDVYASCAVRSSWREESVMQPLQNNDSVTIVMTSQICDMHQKPLCCGTVTWQIKKWSAISK